MKLEHLKILVVMLLFTISTMMIAQQKQKTEANADLIEYTNKEGLPTTNISTVVQTKDGYIWISGIEGTYRFNGYEFEEVREDIGLPKMQDVYYDSTKNIMYFASPTKFITFDGKDFKVYTEKEGYKINGLSGQQISFINEDSKGRIWIGSETPFIDKEYNGGLTKFEDGMFTVYNSKNFPLDNATGFIETPYGDLIFSSSGKNTQTFQGSYVALFKNGVFKKIDESAGITLQRARIYTKNTVTSIDKDGNTWLACMGGDIFNPSKNTKGVLMYDGNEFHQYIDVANLLNKNQLPLEVYYSTKMDRLFLTTYNVVPELFNGKNKSLFEFDNGKWKESNFLKEINEIKDLKTEKVINDFRYTFSFFVNPDKYSPELLILSSKTGNQAQSSMYPDQMYYFTENKWKKFDAFNGTNGTELNEGKLFNTSNGIAIYYPNYSRMLAAKDGLLLTQSGIPTLYTDYNGIVWLSYSYTVIPAYARTADVGINVWDGKKLKAITEKDGLASNVTFQTFQDTQKRVWITTSKGITMVREITNSNGEQIFKLNNIPDEDGKPYNTASVLETKKGDIYTWENFVRPSSENLISADYYLGKFDGEKFVKIKSPFIDADNSKKYQLFNLVEDNDGRLWFFGLFSDNIKDITSAQTMIMLYDGNSWSKPPESWNIPTAQLHYVGNLKNGMYFLTVGSFYVFNGNNFVNLSDSVNANADFRILKGASVAGTQTDIQAGDNLYIRLRNRGLVIFDGTNLNFYTKKEGLPSTNISNPIPDEIRGNVYFSSPSGALKINGNNFQTFYDDEGVVSGGPYVSAMDGFGNMVEFYNGVGLYINKSIEKSYPLKISSVSINGNFNYYQFPTKLSYNDNSFLFNYAALNFKDPQQTTYEHFLEGFDKGWSKQSNLSFAEYQNLPFGKYTFRVRGITSNGVKTNEASYSFVVNPPLWRTWWSYLLYLVIVALGLVGIRKFELDRRKERESKKFLQIENDRKTKELEEARQLQLSMLPKELPQLPNLDIAVYMQTATEVGGDYYDFHVGLDGTLTVVIGDATGHGMKAGTMVTTTKSLFNILAPNPDILTTFSEISRVIKGMKFHQLSMCLMLLKIKGDQLFVSSAGMPPALIYRKKNRALEEIFMKGMPLGSINNFPYLVKESRLEKGDTILMVSDGLPELTNDNKEMYGYDRTKTEFHSVGEKEPEEIVDHLKSSAAQWANGKEPDDDITFVVIKMK